MGLLSNDIEEAKKAAQDITETAVASLFGNLELALQPKILDPIAKTLDGFVDRTLAKLDKFIDQQLKKVRISIGEGE
jgi:hypothetical protein